MKIKYADILELYKSYTILDENQRTRIDSPYLCHILVDEYGGDLDPSELIKGIGIDVYGPIIGRLMYFFNYKINNREVLENIYPTLEKNLGLSDKACNFKVAIWGNGTENFHIDFRIRVLGKLAEKFPNRTFNVNFF